MAESDFSWFKMFSFFGALILVVLCFIMLGFGVSNVVSNETAYGVGCIAAGLVCGCVAAWIYKNYQKKGNH